MKKTKIKIIGLEGFSLKNYKHNELTQRERDDRYIITLFERIRRVEPEKVEGVKRDIRRAQERYFEKYGSSYKYSFPEE